MRQSFNRFGKLFVRRILCVCVFTYWLNHHMFRRQTLTGILVVQKHSFTNDMPEANSSITEELVFQAYQLVLFGPHFTISCMTTSFIEIADRF
jgi:hypothetical protein